MQISVFFSNCNENVNNDFVILVHFTIYANFCSFCCCKNIDIGFILFVQI